MSIKNNENLKINLKRNVKFENKRFSETGFLKYISIAVKLWVISSLPFSATKESERQKGGVSYLAFSTLLSVTSVVSGSELVQSCANIRSPILSKCFLLSACNRRCFIFGPISYPYTISFPSELPQSHAFAAKRQRKSKLVEGMVTAIIPKPYSLQRDVYVDKVSDIWTTLTKHFFFTFSLISSSQPCCEELSSITMFWTQQGS